MKKVYIIPICAHKLKYVVQTKKYCNKMNGIKKLRESLGFIQQYLANYLGIERGHLSMAEIDLRELPKDALIKLNRVEEAVSKNWLAAAVPFVAVQITA
jgi:transcriptional regulator with XRE-family HTH domain